VTVRAFFALELTEPTRAAFGRITEKLETRAPRGVRFEAHARFHVTLKFLGSIEDVVVSALAAPLVSLGTGAPTQAHAKSLVTFPSAARARVVAVELEDSDGALAVLVHALEALAAQHGIAGEERAFRPHVTLARTKAPLDARAWLASHVLPDDPVRFAALVLYKSETLPEGPLYKPIARAPLGE